MTAYEVAFQLGKLRQLRLLLTMLLLPACSAVEFQSLAGQKRARSENVFRDVSHLVDQLLLKGSKF